MGKSKVAILTNFMEFNPGYSLTGIVQDQCKMLQSHGHKVSLFVNEQFNKPEETNQFCLDLSRELPPIRLRANIPFAHLIDYDSYHNLSDDHIKIIQKTVGILVEELKDVPIVFTHDFIFTGWFLPYGLACIEASKHLPNTRFFHWIHSIPSLNRDWWNINAWGKNNHQLIFPNKTDSVRVAEQYRTLPGKVSCIPHIKDLRTWYDFDQDSLDFVDEYPAVMYADMVQVYPASTDRLLTKRISELIQIFSGFKKIGLTTCLVIANQWATGRQRKQDLDPYYKEAKNAGLVEGKEFIFTSEWKTKFQNGLPKNVLRNLMECANIFIFPTREESFGLAGVEAGLCGQLVIANNSLLMMKEVHGCWPRGFEFGSFHNHLNVNDKNAYCHQISILVNACLMSNHALKHKIFCRQRYNWDSLYNNYYIPAMYEKIKKLDACTTSKYKNNYVETATA